MLVVYYPLLGIATLALMTALSRGSLEPEVLGFLLAFGLSFLAALGAGLGWLRAAGSYVLLRPRRKIAGLGPDAHEGASPFAPASPLEGASPFAPLSPPDQGP